MPKIMIVDDESALVFLLKVLLERERFEVVECSDGQQAYDALTGPDAGSLPDVILLDSLMPVMDGYALLAKLREQGALGKIPVIFLSGRDSRPLDPATLPAGVFAFMAKPFDQKNLVKVIKDALASRGAPPA